MITFVCAITTAVHIAGSVGSMAPVSIEQVQAPADSGYTLVRLEACPSGWAWRLEK